MKRILLDTHTFLWWSLEPDRLPRLVREALEDRNNTVFFSVASAWEAQIKIGIGRLVLEDPLRVVVEREVVRNGWLVLPVHLAHTVKLAELPPLHKDPFDRLLVAQALVEHLWVATRDPLVTIYPGLDVIWDVNSPG